MSIKLCVCDGDDGELEKKSERKLSIPSTSGDHTVKNTVSVDPI